MSEMNSFHLNLVPLMHLNSIISVLVKEILLMQLRSYFHHMHILKGETSNSHKQGILLCKRTVINTDVKEKGNLRNKNKHATEN